MKYEVKLQSDIQKLTCFEYIFNKYQGYQSCIREIRINTILGKKCEFLIDKINPPLLCNYIESIDEILNLERNINKLILINSISFIIDDNLNINKLYLEFDYIEDDIQKLLTNNIIEILPKVTNYKNQIIGFYINPIPNC